MQVPWPSFKREVDGCKSLAVVVVQNAHDKDVLMVAFTDEAGFRQTLETGKVSLYSTSRKKSWVKGEESGNFMSVQNILIDCDGDTIVCLVEPQGKGLACHTDAVSCFYRGLFPPRVGFAPKAGDKERLHLKETNVHPDLRRR